MNANQKQIMVAIATSNQIDASELQLIVTAAVNRAMQTGMQPVNAVALFECVKFSILKGMHEQSGIKKATLEDLNGGHG